MCSTTKIFLTSFVALLHFDPVDAIFTCPKSYGYFRDPNDCSVFYRCVNWRPFRFTCQNGAVFDENHDVCTWPSEAWPRCDDDTKDSMNNDNNNPSRQSISGTTAKSNNNRPPTEPVPLGNEVTLWLPEVNTEEQCNFIELTLNVVLQALVQSSSKIKCPNGTCNLSKIAVRCTRTHGQ